MRLLFLFALLLPVNVYADDAASHTIVVTSIETCYAELGPEAAADIQKNYIKPWEECRKRLAIKRKKDQTLKAGETKKPETGESAPDKETPPAVGGYYRVQKTSLKPRPKTETKKAVDSPSKTAPAPGIFMNK